MGKSTLTSILSFSPASSPKNFSFFFMSHGWLDWGLIVAPRWTSSKIRICNHNRCFVTSFAAQLARPSPPSHGRHAVSFSLAELTSHRWFKFTALLGNLRSNLSHWRLPFTKTHNLPYSANNWTHTHTGCGMSSMSPDLIFCPHVKTTQTIRCHN